MPPSGPEVEWNAQYLINLISAAHSLLPANEIGVSRVTRPSNTGDENGHFPTLVIIVHLPFHGT